MHRLMGRSSNKATRRPPVVPVFFSVDDDVSKILDGLLGETPGWDRESAASAPSRPAVDAPHDGSTSPLVPLEDGTAASSPGSPGSPACQRARGRSSKKTMKKRTPTRVEVAPWQKVGPSPAASVFSSAIWILLASAWGAAIGAFGTGAGVWIAGPPRPTVVLIHRRDPPPRVFAVSPVVRDPPMPPMPPPVPVSPRITEALLPPAPRPKTCLGWAALSKVALTRVGRALASPFASFF